MRFHRKKRWLVNVFRGVLTGIIVGILLYYLFEYRKQQSDMSIIETSVNNADELLEKNMAKEALTIYTKNLKLVSEKNEPEMYGHIKNNEGICYTRLSAVSDKEDNLTKAIRACEEALKVYTIERYPVNYATTQNNLGNAYSTLEAGRP
jgi:tetratricopeptide (TPR) repeat protein